MRNSTLIKYIDELVITRRDTEILVNGKEGDRLEKDGKSGKRNCVFV